jgi:hypothetical protein
MFQQNQIHSTIMIEVEFDNFLEGFRQQFARPMPGAAHYTPQGALRPTGLVLEEGPTGMLQRAPEAVQAQINPNWVNAPFEERTLLTRQRIEELYRAMQPYQQHILQGLIHNPEEERRPTMGEQTVIDRERRLELEARLLSPNREAVRAATRPQVRGHMKEERGNIWDHLGTADAICITTNGYFTKNKKAVMERGCAKEAANRYPEIVDELGKVLSWEGNVPTVLKTDPSGTKIVSFPVKGQSSLFDGSNAVRHMASKFRIGQTVPVWALKANTPLIKRSADRLVRLANYNRWSMVIIPRPGCGAGELKWEEVRDAIDPYLDDRFIIVTH